MTSFDHPPSHLNNVANGQTHSSNNSNQTNTSLAVEETKANSLGHTEPFQQPQLEIRDTTFIEDENFRRAVVRNENQAFFYREKKMRGQECPPIPLNHHSFLKTSISQGPQFVSYLSAPSEKQQQPSEDNKQLQPGQTKQTDEFQQPLPRPASSFNFGGIPGNSLTPMPQSSEVHQQLLQFRMQSLQNDQSTLNSAERLSFRPQRQEQHQEDGIENGHAETFEDKFHEIHSKPELTHGQPLIQDQLNYYQQPYHMYQTQQAPQYLNHEPQFICEGCKRTDRHIKKYARNLCQTCYKKKKNEQNLRYNGQYSSTGFVPSTHIPILQPNQDQEQHQESRVNDESSQNGHSWLGTCKECFRKGVKHYAKGKCSNCYRKEKNKDLQQKLQNCKQIKDPEAGENVIESETSIEEKKPVKSESDSKSKSRDIKGQRKLDVSKVTTRKWCLSKGKANPVLHQNRSKKSHQIQLLLKVKTRE